MRPHVSAETMARYRQGDLNQRRTSHIGTHLAGCERCSALNEDLGGVTTLLAGVHPPPMPEDLTARITSAIAAESARRTAAPAAGKAHPSPARPPVARQHRSPRRSRLPRVAPKVALGGLAAAAAVVLVGGGIYKVVTQTGSTASSLASGVPSAAGPATRSPANGPMASALPVSGPALQYQRSRAQGQHHPDHHQREFHPGRAQQPGHGGSQEVRRGIHEDGPERSAVRPVWIGQPGRCAGRAGTCVRGHPAGIAAGMCQPDSRGKSGAARRRGALPGRGCDHYCHGGCEDRPDADMGGGHWLFGIKQRRAAACDGHHPLTER